MGSGSLLTTLSIESHQLGLAPPGHAGLDLELRDLLMPNSSPPPDINLPVVVDPVHLPLLTSWPTEADAFATEAGVAVIADAPAHPKHAGNGTATRKCSKRGEGIWGAWFFFSHYFKPALADSSKPKSVSTSCGTDIADKSSDMRLDVFLVQHDMENMYMWAFKERPENALGKMQLRSFMNGHSRSGEPRFPFSVEKGFIRSHRMQRKQYRGLSNPQCLHGIEVVQSPDLSGVPEHELKKWAELTGRDANFSIPVEAGDFESWRNAANVDFDLEKPVLSSTTQKRSVSCSGFDLSNSSPENGLEINAMSVKRRKDYSPNESEDYGNSQLERDRALAIDLHAFKPGWMNDFSGVMRHSCGPVTAAKTIYEDDDSYLILVSLPFTDMQRVKVTWKNNPSFGVVKISCVSIGYAPCIKRHDRVFKLTDPSPEHCPPGEFVREIPLPTRIPEEANLEAYYDDTGTGLEILVPKNRIGPEEHEVHVSMRPPMTWNQQ